MFELDKLDYINWNTTMLRPCVENNKACTLPVTTIGYYFD